MEKRLVEPREHGTVKEVMVEQRQTVLSKIRHVRIILVRDPILEQLLLEFERRIMERI